MELNTKTHKKDNCMKEDPISNEYIANAFTKIRLSDDLYTQKHLKTLRDTLLETNLGNSRTLRTSIWKKIFLIEGRTKPSLYLKITKSAITYNKPLKANQSEYPKIKDYNVILKDVQRSVLSKLSKCSDKALSRHKSSFQSYLLKAMQYQQESLDYYQGYHDLAIYFHNLEDSDQSVKILQRFTEFYIKPIVSISESLLSVVEVAEKVMHYLHRADYIRIRGYLQDQRFVFTIKWVLSYFANSIMESSIVYKILDFVVLSHGGIIFSIVAEVIIAIDRELQGRMAESELTYGDYYIAMQDFNLESLDFRQILKRVNTEYLGDEVYYPIRFVTRQKSVSEVIYSCRDKRLLDLEWISYMHFIFLLLSLVMYVLKNL